MLAIPLGVLIGLAMPIQTGVNSRLRRSVGSPFLASCISFLVGTVALLAAALIVDRGLPNLGEVAGQPAWIWAGGFLGVAVLTGNILLFPILGSVQTVVLPVTGQILMGILIDHFSWFNSPEAAISFGRVAGAVLLIVGACGVVGSFRKSAVSSVPAPGGARRGHCTLWLWRISAVILGMFSASQSAINGQLGVVLHSAIAAALVSFACGAAALVVIVAVTRTPLRLERVDGQRNPWWMWIGGTLGAIFVFGNALLVPIIGTGLTVMSVLIGLMVGSLIIDHFGLLGAVRKRTTALQVLGMVLMVAGVGMIRLL